MGLTKLQRSEKDARIKAERKAAELQAFRLTGPVARDVPPPSIASSISGRTRGWEYNDHSKQVSEQWSSSIYHGTFYNGTEMSSGSQGARALYSTKELALRAMRHEVELKAAADLYRIDLMLADCK